MNKINTVTFLGKDIDILFQNGFLAYSFSHNGETYGNKVKLASKSVIDITSATALLLINAHDSIIELTKPK